MIGTGMTQPCACSSTELKQLAHSAGHIRLPQYDFVDYPNAVDTIVFARIARLNVKMVQTKDA